MLDRWRPSLWRREGIACIYCEGLGCLVWRLVCPCAPKLGGPEALGTSVVVLVSTIVASRRLWKGVGSGWIDSWLPVGREVRPGSWDAQRSIFLGWSKCLRGIEWAFSPRRSACAFTSSMMKWFLHTSLLLFTLSHMARAKKGSEAKHCDPKECRLPDCYCGGSRIPGDLEAHQVPQFVLLTFDDGVNELNKAFFDDLFKNRSNPNGCPIKATFYVSHEWTDYSNVQDLYADGHEIASHTITHSHGSNFDMEKWANEVVGEAEMLVRYAGVHPKDIKGMRAPFLAIGGDTMFDMLNKYGLTYDSSMASGRAGWPFSLEYEMPFSCSVKPCPEKSHPGMWEIPMTTMKDVRGGSCSMADGCYYEEDGKAIQKIFTKNFLSHYLSDSKTPFPLFFHAAWFFNRPHRVDAFLKFVDSILALDDVYFVTSQELIDWVRYPVPLEEVKSRGLFGCQFPNRPGKCEGRKKNRCRIKHKNDKRDFVSCMAPCPKRYPWLNNLGGE